MKNSMDPYSFKIKSNRTAFVQGVRDGIPIGLGYFAVAFSLGIAAKNAGLNPLQSFIASLLCNASAGEYAGFTLIAAGASYIEMAVMTLVVNARYLLMSCVMSQRTAPDTKLGHRLLVGYDITDELFAIAVARPGFLNPCYSYGAIVVAAPCWATGTALGCIAGNVLPGRIVNALSVALFGMFIAIIIPPARKNKVVAGAIAASFLFSYLATVLPAVSDIPEGSRVILLTVVISAIVAVLFPVKNTDDTDNTDNTGITGSSEHEGLSESGHRC